MSSRRDRSPLGSPILIGALTVLAMVVAVFLAYNANNGLPFVPSYTLHVQVADASELTHGAEVHMGGALIGFVDGVRPERNQNGQPIAVLDLKLNRSTGHLPVDSTFTIRLKGSIGQKYLDVGLGRSPRTYADGATVPMRQTGATVDLDQVLSMFDPPTRAGVVASTVGFSNGLTGRGVSVNDAIGAFVPLLTDLRPVAANLASPRTDLGGFLRGLEAFSGALAPVGKTQANLFVGLDSTFRALAGVSVPFLQQTISETPPSFQAVLAATPVIRPFLTDRDAVQRAAARVRDPAQHRARAGRRVRRRRAQPARNRGARSASGEPVAAPRELRAEPGGAEGPLPAHVDGIEPQSPARVPHAGPVLL